MQSRHLLRSPHIPPVHTPRQTNGWWPAIGLYGLLICSYIIVGMTGLLVDRAASGKSLLPTLNPQRVSQSTAWAAYLLLWVALILGLLLGIRGNWLRQHHKRIFQLHQLCSSLALECAIFHVLMLVVATNILTVSAAFIPGVASPNHQPWALLGQATLYSLILVVFSSHLRAQLGRRIWRGIHFLGSVLFVLATLHGVGNSPSLTSWQSCLYLLCGASVAVLGLFRFRWRSHRQAHVGQIIPRPSQRLRDPMK